MNMAQLDSLIVFITTHNRLPLPTETEAIQNTGISNYMNSDRLFQPLLPETTKYKHPHNRAIANFLAKTPTEHQNSVIINLIKQADQRLDELINIEEMEVNNILNTNNHNLLNYKLTANTNLMDWVK